ncbi:unnamed protein product [Closterium sp. NIES-54]
MVGAVVDTGVVDTSEARLENGRRRHEANEYSDLPWAVVEAGIRAVWATEHPPRPVSPLPVNTKAALTRASMPVVVKLLAWQPRRSTKRIVSDVGDPRDSGQGCAELWLFHVYTRQDLGHSSAGRSTQYSHLEGSHRALVGDGRADRLCLRYRGDAGGPRSACGILHCAVADLHVISRCCSPGVQIALKSCKEHLDASHWAWHTIESTYQITDDLFIGHLEGQLTHPRMGDQETATDYFNRAWRILATVHMAGAQYSTALYVTHVVQGLLSNYNLLKRFSMAPSTRATLNEDTLTSYILQDEAMQEAERSQELLAQVNYVAPTKQGGRQWQRGQCGGDGSSGWKPTKDADKKKSAQDSGRGGGSRRWECWLCGEPDHLSFECPNRSDSDDDNAKGGRGSVVEPTVSLALEAGKDFQAMVATVQANSEVVLLDSGCSHHLMGSKAAFVDLEPSGEIKHACERTCFSASQLKENAVKLQEDGDKMLLITVAGDVLGRASYTGRVLCTALRPCSVKWTTPTTEVVALRVIVSVMKSTPDRLHARRAHSASGADLPCVSCVGGKLARHTFPDQGSDADDMLAVVHIDLCGPFRVAAKDGSLYFLLLKDRKTRYVWVRLVAKKSDALQEFVQWLAVTEWQTKKSVLMLRSHRVGEFLGKQFTDFVNEKGIILDLTCPYTLQKNGMAEREMRTMVESVRMILLHMGVQHHWGHLTLGRAYVLVHCVAHRPLMNASNIPLESRHLKLTVLQCLSSNQMHHVKHLIKDIKCGPKAWKILKDVHAPSSEAMVVVLERQLHAVRINEGGVVQGAFDQLRDLYVKLSAAGVDYPKKIKCYKALSLLPESWGPLVVNLNGMMDSWSLEWIRAQVLQEEFRRKELTAAAGEGGGSAYGMKGFKGRGSKKGKAKEGSGGEQYPGGKRSNKGGKRCGGQCWYCHVEGHPWFKCRKLPDGWRPGQPSIEGSKGVHGAMGEGMGSEEGDGGAGGHGGMFYHVGEACSEDMVVPASKVALHRSSHWVIDTGAFITMTN